MYLLHGSKFEDRTDYVNAETLCYTSTFCSPDDG